MALFSPPVGLDGTAEDYTIAVVGFAFNNDFTELVRVNMHIGFLA
jgi:hypothetical protein